jgi:hypothetical protein
VKFDIAALLGLLSSALGWYVLHLFSRLREQESRRQIRSLAHLQSQIEDLYSPLAGLFHYREKVLEIAVRRRDDPEMGTPEERQRAWDFFLDDYLKPINAQIAALLKSKTHLLEDGHMPEEFSHFLKFQVQSEALYRLWKEKGILGRVDIGKSPENLAAIADAHLKILLQKHDDYLRKHFNI